MSAEKLADAELAGARISTGRIPRGSSKQKFLAVHRWIGASLGLLLLLQGLSGASLVFRDSLEPLLHPELSVVETGNRQQVQALLDAARAASPGSKIDRVEFPGDQRQAVLLKMTTGDDGRKRLVAVDPFSGDIVRQGGLMSWPFEFFQELHEYLLVGEMGEWIIGIEGIALLFLGISGLVAWWPARFRFASGFKVVRGRSAAIFWRTLHRTVGGAIAIVLIFSATTGALMVFKDPFRELLRLGGDVVSKPSAKVAERPGQPLIPIDAIIAKAQSRHGATALRELRFPDSQGRGVSVYLEADKSTRPLATKLLAYDRYTGAELGSYIAGQNPVGNEIVDWLFPLHTGAAAGGWLRFVVFLGGLGLVLLGASGLWLWWKPRLARKKAAQP